MLEFIYLGSTRHPKFKADIVDLVKWRKEFVQATGGLDDIYNSPLFRLDKSINL